MDSTNNVDAFSALGRNTVLVGGHAVSSAFYRDALNSRAAHDVEVDGHPSLPGDPRNVLENVLIGPQGGLPALHCNLEAVELAP